MAYTAKITSKGQVTISKAIREKLKSEIIEFEEKHDHIEIRAVKGVAGALKSYASPGKLKEETTAWQSAAEGKHEHR